MNVFDENGEPKKKRAKSYSQAGPRKSILVAIACGVTEHATNIQTIFDKIGINNFTDMKFYIETDLKLINIILGLGSHSSKFPCPFGECFREGLNDWKLGKLRDFRSLKNHFEAYENEGSATSMNHASIKTVPLLTNEKLLDILVMAIFPPPPLHCIKLGPVNHILKQLIRLCVIPEPVLLRILKGFGCHWEQQHGGIDTIFS